MQPFHAVVKNGRLTLDTPSDLPDDQVVVLVALDDLLTLVDDSGEQPVALFAPPERAWKRSRPVDAAAILDELRSL